MSPSGIEPVTCWFVAQCVNQPSHRMPYLSNLYRANLLAVNQTINFHTASSVWMSGVFLRCTLYTHSGKTDLHLFTHKLQTFHALCNTYVPRRPAQVGNERTYGQLYVCVCVCVRARACMYVCVCRSWNPIPTHRNLIGNTMTTPPPVLSPSSVLPVPSPSSHFHSRMDKFDERFKRVII